MKVFHRLRPQRTSRKISVSDRSDALVWTDSPLVQIPVPKLGNNDLIPFTTDANGGDAFIEPFENTLRIRVRLVHNRVNHIRKCQIENPPYPASITCRPVDDSGGVYQTGINNSRCGDGGAAFMCDTETAGLEINRYLVD